MKRLFLATLFLWAGFLLILVPWSLFWERNYFAQSLPLLQALMRNNYLRGAISGLGVVNVYFGLAELIAAITTRPSPPPSLGASSVSPRE